MTRTAPRASPENHAALLAGRSCNLLAGSMCVDQTSISREAPRGAFIMAHHPAQPSHMRCDGIAARRPPLINQDGERGEFPWLRTRSSHGTWRTNFKTEKDSPYLRFVRSEGLDVISAHYVRNLRTIELKPWARKAGKGVFIN